MEDLSKTGFEDWVLDHYAFANQGTILEQQKRLEMWRLEGEYQKNLLDTSDRRHTSMNGPVRPFIEVENINIAILPAPSHAMSLEEGLKSRRLGCWSSAQFQHLSGEDYSHSLETRPTPTATASNHSDGQGFQNPESGFQTTEPSTLELEEVVSVSDQLCQEHSAPTKRKKTYKKLTLEKRKEIYGYCKKNTLKEVKQGYPEIDPRQLKHIYQNGPYRKQGSGQKCKDQDYESILFSMMYAITKKYQVEEVNQTVLKLADTLLMKEKMQRTGGWRAARMRRFRTAKTIKRGAKINEIFISENSAARKLWLKLQKK